MDVNLLGREDEFRSKSLVTAKPNDIEEGTWRSDTLRALKELAVKPICPICTIMSLSSDVARPGLYRLTINP